MWLGFLVGSPDILTNADYFVYYDSYVYHNQTFEQGYMFLAGIYENLGISYATFRLQLSLIAMLVLWFGIIRITRYPSLAIILFSISNFFVDVIQMRNLLMLALAVFGFSFIKNLKSYKQVILGLVIVYCSLLFHSVGIFFVFVAILFVLPHFIFKKISLSISIISIFLNFLLITSFGRNLVDKVLIFSVSLVSQRSNITENLLNVYQNSASNRYWIESAIVILLICLIAYLIKSNSNLQSQKNQILFVTLSFVPLLLFSLALLKISQDYSRAIRNLGFLYAVMLIDPASQSKYLINKVYNLLFVSIISISLGWLSIFSGYYQYVVPNIPNSIKLNN
ncbi:hypothetical protein FCS82_00705 [Oenococcus sp. UCMA 14587]|nr:hypothetical protein [Oenococcus sp. UCMA 14587]